MKIDQYYLDCLSQASYLIADETSGVAAVVDPRRDVQEYLDDAAAAGLRIAYVIETHFHADFLSGHLELAAATGAEIVYGDAADTEFEARKVADGERISLGTVVLEFRHTPGHTPESISVVVWESEDAPEPYAVLTGDTLFIGDVGRPDLLASKGVSAESLGLQLYDSLWTKLMGLPDATRVFPAHGAGSACGKNLSTETVSTIGEQRRTNYALQIRDRDRFVEVVTEGQPKAPDYFLFDAGQNRAAHKLMDTSPPALMDLDGVLAARDRGAVLLDVRGNADFAAGHIAGSINVGLDGRFAEYVGTVVDPHADIVVIAEPGTAQEAKLRLGRIGFDRVVGALEGPEAALVARPEVAARSSRITAAALSESLGGTEGLQVVDLRNQGERIGGSVPGAVHIPLAALRARAGELDFDRPIVVHCAGGYRSSIAASWLAAHGARDVSDLLGGFGAWVDARQPVT